MLCSLLCVQHLAACSGSVSTLKEALEISSVNLGCWSSERTSHLSKATQLSSCFGCCCPYFYRQVCFFFFFFKCISASTMKRAYDQHVPRTAILWGLWCPWQNLGSSCLITAPGWIAEWDFTDHHLRNNTLRPSRSGCCPGAEHRCVRWAQPCVVRVSACGVHSLAGHLPSSVPQIAQPVWSNCL